MDLEQKIEIFSRRLSQDPHARVFAPLADLLRQSGRLEDALELLDEGLGRHPDYVSALVIKGRTLMDSGRVEDARHVLGRVLELDAENFVVLRLMTEEARSRQAWTEAIPLLEKLVVLDPDDSRWAGALEESRRLAEPPEISHEGEESSPLGTDSSFATMTLVDIYLAQGYRDKALDALRQMAAREPDRPDVLDRIAEIQAAGPAVPPAPSGPAIPPLTGPDDSGSLNRHVAKRSHEKKKFEDWIDRIRQDGGASS